VNKAGLIAACCAWSTDLMPGHAAASAICWAEPAASISQRTPGAVLAEGQVGELG
jgi:hypothetical protein